MSIEKVTQERLDIAQQLKNELEEMRDIQEESGDFLSKQLGLYKDVNVINKELLAKESLKRNVGNDFAKQQLKQIQGQNIIRKNVIGSRLKEFVAIVQPITGGKAPDAPPITIFWGVFLLSQIV